MKIFGRGVWASLAALFLFCGVSSESAWAKAFDMEMTGITVTAINPADQAGPQAFYVNAKLRIECRYRWGEFKLKNPPVPLVIGFAYDHGGNMPIFPQIDLGPPAAAGTIGTAAVEWSPKETGNYKLMCTIMKKDNTVPGALDANLANNSQYAYPIVKPRPPGKVGSPPAGAVAIAPGGGVVPGLSGNVKQCPTSLSAAVKVDPHQLVHPLNSPADTAETKVMLYLQKSEAAANNVNCYYASHNKDVPKLVVTIKCPNASSQSGKPGAFNCTN
jgi:hypothetical protein